MLDGQVLRAGLYVAALAFASGSGAADLFLPVGTAGAGAEIVPAAGSTTAQRTKSVVSDMWERRVRLARHELTSARTDVASVGAGRLLLNVTDSVRLDVVVERTAATRWGYSLSGRIVGRRGGFVTLVVHEEAVAAYIWTPNSAWELTYLGGGIHALRNVTNVPPIECAGALPSRASAGDMQIPKSNTTSTTARGTDDGSVVDILVVWTPTAETPTAERHRSGSQVCPKSTCSLATLMTP